MANLEESYAVWKKSNGIEDYTDADRASRAIFTAGWSARGNAYTNVASLALGLALIAYIVTIILNP